MSNINSAQNLNEGLDTESGNSEAPIAAPSVTPKAVPEKKPEGYFTKEELDKHTAGLRRAEQAKYNAELAKLRDQLTSRDMTLQQVQDQLDAAIQRSETEQERIARESQDKIKTLQTELDKFREMFQNEKSQREHLLMRHAVESTSRNFGVNGDKSLLLMRDLLSRAKLQPKISDTGKPVPGELDVVVAETFPDPQGNPVNRNWDLKTWFERAKEAPQYQFFFDTNKTPGLGLSQDGGLSNSTPSLSDTPKPGREAAGWYQQYKANQSRING